MNVLIRETQQQVLTETVGTQDWLEASKDFRITSYTQSYTPTTTLSAGPIPIERLDDILARACLSYPASAANRRIETPVLIDDIFSEYDEAWKTLATL